MFPTSKVTQYGTHSIYWQIHLIFTKKCVAWYYSTSRKKWNEFIVHLSALHPHATGTWSLHKQRILLGPAAFSRVAPLTRMNCYSYALPCRISATCLLYSATPKSIATVRASLSVLPLFLRMIHIISWVSPTACVCPSSSTTLNVPLPRATEAFHRQEGWWVWSCTRRWGHACTLDPRTVVLPTFSRLLGGCGLRMDPTFMTLHAIRWIYLCASGSTRELHLERQVSFSRNTDDR